MSTILKRSVPVGLAASLAALSILPVAARAQQSSPTRVTILAGSDCPQTWTWELSAALRRVENARPHVLSPRTVGPVARRDTQATLRDRLHASMAAAERAFRQADFEECVAGARVVDADLVPRLAEQGLLAELPPFLSIAAACELKRGAPRLALERILFALAIDPGLSFNADRYPPDVAGLIDEGRSSQASVAPLEIVPDPNVPDARVEIDGRPVTLPPDRTVMLPPGPHALVARARGAATLVRPLSVAGAGRVALELTPADPSSALAQIGGGLRSADLDDSAARAAAAADGSTIVLIIRRAERGTSGVGGARVEVVLRQVVGLAVSQLGRASSPEPEDAAAWSRLLDRVHSSLRAPDSRSVTGSGVTWWPWAAAGAVVVAAGAIVLAVLLDEPERAQLVPGGLCPTPDTALEDCYPWR
ncbi:MAG: hypothetical protein HYY06_21050 [Deltaproteobacteria bacterium]|nr:hypothetical protein [Deltaproteobacteria bacterium]